MTPERWREIKAVVATAIEKPPSDRVVFLDVVCGADIELRHEVDTLLVAAEDTGTFDQAIAAEALAVVSRAEPALERDPALRAILESAVGHQYEILHPLGHGGMGAVFLARERALERFVAIKVLQPDLAAEPASRERFRREARNAAQLSHPSILPLYTFGEVGGLWYFVMGYVRGQSLAERLRLEVRLPVTHASRILYEVAEALECAHHHGVVHRDVKPSNIMLDDESGRAILLDFGISKTGGGGDSLTSTGAVIGTPHYMSPEQVLGLADVDARSDLYSLGAVGYTMLAGREPFGGASAGELIYRRLSHDPPSLESVAPTVPADCAAVITRCLARDRTERWPDATSLKEALARVCAGPDLAAPESLRDLPSFGPYALLWVVAWTAIAVVAPSTLGDRLLLLFIASLVPIGLVLHISNAARHGLRRGEVARIACWPPEWWGMWWPRALRRPGDLWMRLPAPARSARLVMSAFVFALPTVILVRQAPIARRMLAGDSAQRWFDIVELALIVGAAAVAGGALWWARRRGLPAREAVRVLFGATVPAPIWSAPNVARLLTPVTGGARPPDRDVPADYRQAVVELVRLLPRDMGGEVSRNADRLLSAIEELDADIATLAREASAAEVDRLSAQLAALGDPSSRATDEGRELRALVQHQLDLVRRIRARGEQAAYRRAHLFDLLRGLWAQLCRAAEAGGDGPSSPSRAIEHVRALCTEIAGELTPAAPPSHRPRNPAD